MAEIEPLRALHYDLEKTGGLQPVVAPPYDVIDAEQRAELEARSPYNVVAHRPPRRRAIRTSKRRTCSRSGAARAWSSSDQEPALWTLEQDYTGPDGQASARAAASSPACASRSTAPGRIRPHERTHPGPKEDRLRLTRATKANLSPIFSLFSDPDRRGLARAGAVHRGRPWGEATDDDGTVNRLWRVDDPAAIDAGQASALAVPSC